MIGYLTGADRTCFHLPIGAGPYELLTTLNFSPLDFSIPVPPFYIHIFFLFFFLMF